jgi:hypothetical protein
MPRRKRSSKVLAKSERRAAGMASISATLDLGNSLTLFNSKVDKAYSDILNDAHELGCLSRHVLLDVATKYGKSSE